MSEAALVVGREGAPHASSSHTGRAEVGVVEDRPAVAGVGEGGRQVRLPDALGQPGAGRPPPEGPLDAIGHAPQLGDPIALRQGREDRLVKAAAEELHLVALDQRPQPAEEVGLARRAIQSSSGPE